MLDLFGNPLKVKKSRRPRTPLKAFASATEKGQRYPALIRGARVETLCATVSPSCYIWVILGPTAKATRAAMRASQRLKRAGYRHVFAEVSDVARDTEGKRKDRAPARPDPGDS